MSAQLVGLLIALATAALPAAADTPGFWRILPAGSPGGFTPLRLAHDNAGYLYTSSTASRAHDVVNGVQGHSLLRISEATGEVDPNFVWDDSLGSPVAIVVRSDGKLVVAVGLGVNLPNTATNGATLVCIDQTGAPDPTFSAPLFRRSIRQLGIQPDGKILVIADGPPADDPLPGALEMNALYRLNPNGSLDNGFLHPQITTLTAAAPIVDGSGRIYLAGQLQSVAGSSRSLVARFNSSGELDSQFGSPNNPASMVPGLAGIARAAHLQSDGKLVLVGRFARSGRGSLSTDSILAIRFNEDGAFDDTYAQVLRSETGIGPSNNLSLRGAIADGSGGILVSSNRLLRLDANGAVDATFTPRVLPREGFSLSRSPSTGALFITDLADEQGNNFIASFTPAGEPRQEFVARNFGLTTPPTFAHALIDGRILVGGTFNRFQANSVPGSVLFDADGSVVGAATAYHDPLAQPIDPIVQLSVAPDGSFLLHRLDAGNPSNGAGRTESIRWFSAAGQDVTAWAGVPTLASYTVGPNRTIFTWNSTLNANSALSPIGVANWLTKLSADGTTDETFAADLSWLLDIVRAPGDQIITNMKIGRILAGRARDDGGLDLCVATTEGSVRIVRLLASGARDLSYAEPVLGVAAATAGFSPSLVFDAVSGAAYQIPMTTYNSGVVGDWLVLPDGKAFLTGSMAINGQPRGVARLLANGALDSNFTGSGLAHEAPFGLSPRGDSLALDGEGRVYVAGRFTSVNGTPLRGLARFGADGTLDTTWTPQVEVRATHLRQNRIVVSGGILHVFGAVASSGGDATGYLRVPLETPAATGFEAFVADYFSAEERADVVLAGPNADPDGDGLSNLVEYALGLHPRNASTSNLPQAGTTATHWTYTYTRPADRGDLVYTVEASTNLTAWNVLTPTHEMIGSQDGLQTWRASVPLNSGTSVFFRLRVASPTVDLGQ